VNTYARAVRAFWSWLAREGVIKSSCLRELPAPKLPRLLPRAFNEAEVRRILRAADHRPRDRAMVLLLVDSGIRLGELLGLKLSDFDLGQGRFRVFGKGGKERHVYFSPRTAEALQDYIRLIRPKIKTEDRMFLNADGGPMDRRRVGKILEMVGREAGLERRLSPQKLRHTFATLSLRYGNNLEYLRLALGHAHIETTSRCYLAASEADVEKAHRRSSPISNLYG
jgi:integrase/recombinase XerD